MEIFVSNNVVSIRTHLSYEHSSYLNWKIQIAKWREETIERNGGWRRGNPRNLRPYLVNRNLVWWFNDLYWSYKIKAEVDLVTKGIVTNRWY